MKNNCGHYQETLQRLPDDPEMLLSDDFALHLDECVHCRRLFDASRVPLDPESFEVLAPASRERILQALAAVRSQPRGRIPLLAAVAGLAAVIARDEPRRVGLLHHQQDPGVDVGSAGRRACHLLAHDRSHVARELKDEVLHLVFPFLTARKLKAREREEGVDGPEAAVVAGAGAANLRS